jgi:hypothetical protein
VAHPRTHIHPSTSSIYLHWPVANAPRFPSCCCRCCLLPCIKYAAMHGVCCFLPYIKYAAMHRRVPVRRDELRQGKHQHGGWAASLTSFCRGRCCQAAAASPFCLVHGQWRFSTQAGYTHVCTHVRRVFCGLLVYRVQYPGSCMAGEWRNVTCTVCASSVLPMVGCLLSFGFCAASGAE